MSHQDRRLPLPADYQFPTHGVDCDCPPCRNRFIRAVALTWSDYIDAQVEDRVYRENYMTTTQTAYGWGV